jgi:hypothetical protein
MKLVGEQAFGQIGRYFSKERGKPRGNEPNERERKTRGRRTVWIEKKRSRFPIFPLLLEFISSASNMTYLLSFLSIFAG